MPESFDPCLKWLGIPSHEQPPNHYRLLGIPLFMADNEVISNAADQRMIHLKGFQSGRYSALSQKLLNEVSAARGSLLDPVKKSAYDALLKKGAGAKTVRAAPAARESTSLPDPDDSAWTFPVAPKPTSTPGKSARSKATPGRPPKRPTPQQQRRQFGLNLIGHIFAPLVGLGLGAIILYFIHGWMGESPPKVSQAVSTSNAPSVVAARPAVPEPPLKKKTFPPARVPRPPTLDTVETAYAKADKLLERKDYERAIEAYSRIIRRKPDYAKAYQGRALAYAAKENVRLRSATATSFCV